MNVIIVVLRVSAPLPLSDASHHACVLAVNLEYNSIYILPFALGKKNKEKRVLELQRNRSSQAVNGVSVEGDWDSRDDDIIANTIR